MKKVLIIAAKANMIQQFNRRNILILKNLGCQVHVGANFKQFGSMDNLENNKLKNWLDENDIVVHQLDFERGFGSFKINIKVIKQIKQILINPEEWSFIHVHSPIGSVLGRIAAKQKRVNVIYTAHGFHFFKNAPLKNWIVFPVEWFLSLWTKELLVINKYDLNIAKYLPIKQVTYIPSNGVDVKGMLSVSNEEKKKQREIIRNSLNLSSNDFVILNVGELSSRKNQEVIIRAISRLKNKNIKFICAGTGPKLNEYDELARSLNIDKQIIMLGYRNDIENLHFASDVFIFPSLREGFGLGGFEALVDGLPVIGSKNTGMADYIHNFKNGLLINPKNDEVLSQIINDLYNKRISFERTSKKELMKFDNSVVDRVMLETYKKYIN